MKSKVQEYVEGTVSYFEDGLREDDELALVSRLDKLWFDMSDEERELAEREIEDIVDIKFGGT
jgi:hypothetical protein